MASEMKNTSSDSFHKCGDFLPCYKDRDVILKMQGEAPALAVKYTLVILSCYLIGLVILWIHYVKQKYGEVGITLQVVLVQLCGFFFDIICKHTKIFFSKEAFMSIVYCPTIFKIEDCSLALAIFIKGNNLE